jgi:UDP-2-acetamido-2-deoxy-ribo-hexuluronate aminotransferase
MTIPFINLKAQYAALQVGIQARIQNVLEHGQYIMGPEVSELEEKLVKYTGAKYCITVASGTEALLISLMSLGIGPGDEVITTPFTFAATVEVIVLLGAQPIYVDIDPNTCNINANLIEAKITKKTKAIIPVSLYGQPSDMDVINSIAFRNGNIPVIEDAAQSFGAEYRGKKSCNLSLIGCTSFFPSKPLGCYGDGGAIFTDNESIAEACRQIRVHGQSQRYVHTRIGVGGRMDTIQCAVVLAKLERFDWEVEQRLRLGHRYNQLFDYHRINRIQQIHESSSVFAQYTIYTNQRDDLQRNLSSMGIPSAIHYPIPLNEQPAYSHLCCADCTPVAKKMAGLVMSLPMSPDLSNEELEQIVEAVRSNLIK